jgi:hypothetical protein
LHVILRGEDLSLGGAPCRIYVTDRRLLWILDARPETLLDEAYENFIGLGINFDSRELAFEAKRRPIEYRGYKLPPASPESLLGALYFRGTTDSEAEIVDQALTFVSSKAGPHCSKLGETVLQEVARYIVALRNLR